MQLQSLVQKEIIWCLLSLNPNAIYLIEQKPDEIDWVGLSSNKNALHMLSWLGNGAEYQRSDSAQPLAKMVSAGNDIDMRAQCKNN